MTEPTSPQHRPAASRLTPEEREAFLRRQGWRPELPQAQRETIEAQWSDGAIEEALLIGF
ncbi:hypothetical protein [Kineococcus radiotolerans]|uniref:hypothetical protein n=1 Tax=Kineococcus radiotolerans TaxID=131568 RepID=UPI00003A4347|nr:hypothetical protein [Kineococcus radiotolerans]